MTTLKRCRRPECGELNPAKAQFCASCGQSLAVQRPFDEPARAAPLRSLGVSYGLWALCIVGAAGIHRFYLGRWITGIIWLCTWGLFGLGLLIDLIIMPGIVDRANYDLARRGRW